MAFWAASPNLRLNALAPMPHTTLEQRLLAVGNAGHDVKVILWDPGLIEQWAHPEMGAGHHAASDAFRTALDGKANGNISVYLERVNRYVPGASNHQKIVITSVNGQRRVLVGGLNLDDWYWDTPAHPGGMGGYGGSIHDTAIHVEGPATDAVEQEWVRRWERSGLPLRRNTAVQALRPPIGGHSVNVTIATTNAEGWWRKADIQSLLCERIAAANQYIYLENYAITDPTIVAAIATRLSQPAPPRVILLVPFPQGGVYSYLHYITYAKLAFQSCTSVVVPGPQESLLPVSTRTISRAGSSLWQLSQSYNAWSTLRSISSTFYNQWMENDRIQWRDALTPGAGTQSCRLLDIIGFNGGIRMYSPLRVAAGGSSALYIHSKLALIDDEVAVIGSANFNYRSMVYDGEIAAFIRNPTRVQQIRNALFAHWNMGAPAAWDGTAQANRVALGNHTLAPGTRVIPLDIGDFDKTVPDYKQLNFTMH
ncbi:hypothetical protein DAT35_21810 [Vitiosangium sp. GDMCC 1.1324]|nr:hypothetical protein DAT35_21810 [Vitiosangium sp. GDMCC 1.1324]